MMEVSFLCLVAVNEGGHIEDKGVMYGVVAMHLKGKVHDDGTMCGVVAIHVKRDIHYKEGLYGVGVIYDEGDFTFLDFAWVFLIHLPILFKNSLFLPVVCVSTFRLNSVCFFDESLLCNRFFTIFLEDFCIATIFFHENLKALQLRLLFLRLLCLLPVCCFPFCLPAFCQVPFWLLPFCLPRVTDLHFGCNFQPGMLIKLPFFFLCICQDKEKSQVYSFA